MFVRDALDGGLVGQIQRFFRGHGLSFGHGAPERQRFEVGNRRLHVTGPRPDLPVDVEKLPELLLPAREGVGLDCVSLAGEPLQTCAGNVIRQFVLHCLLSHPGQFLGRGNRLTFDFVAFRRNDREETVWQIRSQDLFVGVQLALSAVRFTPFPMTERVVELPLVEEIEQRLAAQCRE